MADVYPIGVGQIVELVSSGEWQAPGFQRPFVWSHRQVAALCESILKGMPCGLITSWVLRDEVKVDLDLQKIGIDTPSGETHTLFPDGADEPGAVSAVIDGRQRSTAIAVAFGGLHIANASFRWGGRFYVNLDAEDIDGSVSFKKVNEIKREKLDEKKSWVETGLFPLGIQEHPPTKLVGKGDPLFHWSSLAPCVTEPELVKGVDPEKLPDQDKREKREERHKDFLEKISSESTLGHYQIGNKFSLSDVCDTFEVLNTAGTKVSAVDVVHSLLFTHLKCGAYKDGQFQLRDWIAQDVNDKSGSIGWGKKPLVTAQLVVSTYLGLDEGPKKDQPRPLAGKVSAIVAVKNKDILSLPYPHWGNVVDQQENEGSLSGAIGAFQKSVLGQYFPGGSCPYPMIACVYVGLWWHRNIEGAEWSQEELNALFKTFFWRASLSEAYEQLHSTVIGKDINGLKVLLGSIAGKGSREKEKQITKWFDERNLGIIEKEKLIKYLVNDTKPEKALKSSLDLAVLHLPENDILSPMESVAWPVVTEAHHIFPKDWIKKNINRECFPHWHREPDLIEEKRDSVANQTPLLKKSNVAWSSSNPATMIENMEHKTQEKGQSIWTQRFIGDEAYEHLKAGEMEPFIATRAEELADWLIEQCRIVT